jgi:hypothetical protein
VLVEVAGSNAEHDAAKLMNFTEKSLDSEIVKEGILSQVMSQLNALWKIRETAPEGILHFGGKPYK